MDLLGKTIAHYQFSEKLGDGGMGVVYRAEDTRLGRPVAIKFLPARFISDPERLARFHREARMLASLNHPNIGSIYGLEESDGACYLVLELVPGETLADHLSRGKLDIGEALGICRQIAEALEAAHEKGIVHRDLKPANVMITPEGKVKVLDFGLAKAVQADDSYSPQALSQSPTVSMDATRQGVVMGTGSYMSPEQARGIHVDKRSDIWAFGCVLYETLSGRRAFPGQTLSDCVAAVLEKEPVWNDLPAAAPQHVERLLRRCLKKDPQKRLQCIADARLELEEAPVALPVVRPTVPLVRFWMIAASALLCGALLTIVVALTLWRTPSGAITRFTLQIPRDEVYTTTYNSSVALSPDGKKLAYRAMYKGRPQLFLRPLDQLEAQALPGTEGSFGLYFSPDNQWLVFGQPAPERLRKIAVSGGAPITFSQPPVGIQGLTFAPDGTVLFSSFGSPVGLYRTPLAGGKAELAIGVDPRKGERHFRLPQLLPDGEHVLVTVGSVETETWDDGRIVVLSLKTSDRRTLVEGGTSGRYVPPGYLVYARAGAMLAVPFDVKHLTVTGSPVTVFEGLAMHVNNAVAHFSLSDKGDLAYAPGTAGGADRRLVWVNRQGKAEPLPLPPRSYLHPRISPDGSRFAVEIEGPNHDFWLYEMERGVLSRMTTGGQSHWPLWTPDGSRLTFRTGMPGPFTMWWMPADRSATPDQLTSIGKWQSAASWTPDGKTLVFTQIFDPETGADIYTLELSGDRTPRPFVRTKFDEGAPRFSPDGRWIAYVSNETGRNEVYVQPYPGPGPKIQISADGGTDPLWVRKTGELVYRNGDKMMGVVVTLQPVFNASRPRLLWEGHYSHGISTSCGPPGTTSSNYDVTADGQRFLMVSDSELDTTPRQINVVLNWVEELKRLMQAKAKP